MKKLKVDPELFEIVRGLLVAPRTLTAKTATAIAINLDVDDPINGIGSDKVAALEEYEAELLFSPLFTPTDKERRLCEQALSPDGINSDTLDELYEQLLQAELSCPVVYGLASGSLKIPAIIIDRYVRLLGLTSKVSERIVSLLESAVEQENRHWAFSLARRPVWRSSSSCELLAICLEKMVEKSSFSAEKMDFLTGFVRTYRPPAANLLLTSLKNMVDSYHKDQDHPVYNRNLAKKQENSLMPLSCSKEVRAKRVAMADSLLADFS
ncbi:MAG: hypothetical protein HQL70_08075 [Magnetococcales bacterium]|nr:hypothetical protein [Magnetococcales bacterium]